MIEDIDYDELAALLEDDQQYELELNNPSKKTRKTYLTKEGWVITTELGVNRTFDGYDQFKAFIGNHFNRYKKYKNDPLHLFYIYGNVASISNVIIRYFSTFLFVLDLSFNPNPKFILVNHLFN